jgi:hypothetical protein
MWRKLVKRGPGERRLATPDQVWRESQKSILILTIAAQKQKQKQKEKEKEFPIQSQSVVWFTAAASNSSHSIHIHVKEFRNDKLIQRAEYLVYHVTEYLVSSIPHYFLLVTT